MKCHATNPDSRRWVRKGKHKKMRMLGPIRCIEPVGHAFGSNPTLHSDGRTGWHLPGEPLYFRSIREARVIEYLIEDDLADGLWPETVEVL